MEIFSIAEVGINHLGSYEKALRMIHLASKAGARAVKFQKYNPLKVLGKGHPSLNDAHQLTWVELKDLSSEAHRLSLLFGISIFDINDIAIATPLVDFHKVASRMNRATEFIAKIEACKLPVYMSIQPETTDQRIPERFKLMWCIREYPSTEKEVLSYPYSEHFGLSSHCPDWRATLEAVKRGARVIENHVKENDKDLGCDMSSSLNFNDYETLLSEIKKLEIIRR
jgi:sialic acid synthase SpsE